ncbi:hypothetical protein SCALM49S_09618 [Streptomyces californicus]
MRVLLVEERQEDLREMTAAGLRDGHSTINCAADWPEADVLLHVDAYDCSRGVQPDGASGDTLAPLEAGGRAGWSVPVLCLTALDSLDERVRGLESGADDYLAKPFAMRGAGTARTRPEPPGSIPAPVVPALRGRGHGRGCAQGLGGAVGCC